MNHPPSAPSSPPAKALLLPLALCLAFGILLAVFLRHPAPAVAPASPPPEFNRTNLVHLDGRWCLAGHTNPLTGILIDYYPDGTPESRSVISNGLLNGLSEGWYTNRQLQVREYYRTNFSNGLRTKWYPDGKKQSEATIVLGKMQGTFRRWYENGRLAEEIPMRDGKIEGVGRSWYQSGFMKTELTIHEGKVVKSVSWPDGKQPGQNQDSATEISDQK